MSKVDTAWLRMEQPTNLMMMKSLDVLGCPAAISVAKDPSIREERLRWLLRSIEEGKIVPYISQVFELTDVKAALRAKWASRHVGCYVLHP